MIYISKQNILGGIHEYLKGNGVKSSCFIVFFSVSKIIICIINWHLQKLTLKNFKNVYKTKQQ